ncbi:MAG TPA: alpha/beta hydrolase, partial [Candidatus Acidoferrum sp.]
MDDNNTASNTPPPGRLKRYFWRGLLVLFALVAAAAVLGACYQFFENNADARRFPQKGKSVSLGPAFGNLTLNLDCEGEGSPTVILDSGLGVPAVGWNHVQAETAKFTRVCSYDRAGYGWSGVTTAPRTSAQIVKELHALLEAAHEKGPFILVGHSFGGFNVRVYN